MSDKFQRDSSTVLYNKYFSLKNRSIKITLKNNSIISGKISGLFYYKDFEKIKKWHIISNDTFLGEDYFGNTLGKIIEHSDIKSIFFYDDNSSMEFESL